MTLSNRKGKIFFYQDNILYQGFGTFRDKNILYQIIVFHGSSLFQNRACQFHHSSDYVIGHDVIGHPEVRTDN